MNFFIALNEDGTWIGVAGYEVYGKDALLRSVAVDKGARGMGHGRALVYMVLSDAAKRDVSTVYLLTETAEEYFKGLGFEPIDRAHIPDSVKKSAEFAECGAVCQAMRKSL